MVHVARRKRQTKINSQPSATPFPTYNVLVLATMSAGKSSLINALIGRELLPAGNEATTACLTRIERKQRAKYFRGSCFSHAGSELISQRQASIEHVRAWNLDAQVKHIHLAGKFSNVSRLPSKLVLHDTPGPNNSQDQRHAEMMLEAVRTVPFQSLCYVLNGSQLATQDDCQLLEQLRELVSNRAALLIIFILNKVDLLDPERGEDLATCVSNARAYLERLGFVEPVVVPMMADLALFARKALNESPLTRVERNKLRISMENVRFGEHCARDLEQLLNHSGIKTVESLLYQHSIAIQNHA